MGSERDAEALHARDEIGGGVILGAIEDHVLEEMGEAALVIGLHERAGGDVEAE